MTTDAATGATSRWQEAVIERIVPRTPRVISVFLRVRLDAYVAGQHVDVRLTAPDGYQAQRSYSIASAPGAKDIELAIERLEDGEVSPFFHEVARPGDTIEVRGPIGGHFIWRAEDGGPILLIGGGSGVVPLMAIVREWSATEPKTPVLLV
jgi:ferredoxin-NADP reductase